MLNINNLKLVNITKRCIKQLHRLGKVQCEVEGAQAPSFKAVMWKRRIVQADCSATFLVVLGLFTMLAGKNVQFNNIDMSDRFAKADSNNLPQMNNAMILEYMAVSNKHNLAEIRGAKIAMTSRDSYLNTAVGYVEVSRSAGQCIVKAKIVPEHKIGNKLYAVKVIINEIDDVVLDASCDDCAAAMGGCKHSLLLLFWLCKRSDEPAPTSTQCYWLKPKLSSVRTEMLECTEVFKRTKRIKVAPKDSSILHKFQNECRLRQIKNSLITDFDEMVETKTFNLFDMTIEFAEKESNHNFEHFKEFLDKKVTREIIEEINENTKEQSGSKLWCSMRQGRLTASILHQAAHCKTDGMLVQQILGGYKVPETFAIKRGKKLEQLVIKEIEKKMGLKIDRCGFMIIDSILGASPDGITENYVIEIKCPASIKSMEKYVKNGIVQDKFKSQIYCQMLASNKKKGLFCVADPTFEETKIIYMYCIEIDYLYIEDIINKAKVFWKTYIFPKILQSAKM